MRKYYILLLCLIATPALAHPGHGVLTFNDGFLHPLTGIDHLLMLSSVGILSAKIGQPGRFICGALLAMFSGSLVGHYIGDFTGMEPLINISVFVACGVILCAAHGRTIWLVPFLLTVHGWAHGVEGSSGDAFYIFTAGFLLASGGLLFGCHFLGKFVYRYSSLRKFVGVGGIIMMTMNVLSQ
ncbi:HupE/UreJ family protein [Klebsiella aerogenes]|nr:HupE/UreJ family protein [Klebsiella aerogenes]